MKSTEMTHRLGCSGLALADKPPDFGELSRAVALVRFGFVLEFGWPRWPLWWG